MAELRDRLLYCALTSFIRFKMSFALSFFDTLVEFFVFETLCMFLLEDEVVMAGLEAGGLRFDGPVSLFIACFCFSLSAGENSRFLRSALEDLIEFQSFYLLLDRAGLFRTPWLLLFIRCDETTGRVGGLYSVFLGIEGVLILGVVFNSSFLAVFERLLSRSTLFALVLLSKFCLTRLLVYILLPDRLLSD